MPKLTARKRERFAIAIAGGMPAAVAYLAAGYSDGPAVEARAAALAAVPEVAALIKETQAGFAELQARRPNHWRPISESEPLPVRAGWYAIEFATEGPGLLPDTAYWNGTAFVAIVIGAVRRSAYPFNDEPAAFGWAADHYTKAMSCLG